MSRFVTLMLVLFLLIPSAAQAQTDFSTLPVRAGDTIHVKEISGAEVSGPISKISTNTVVIGKYEIPIASVLQIDRRGDGLWNGFLIGAGIYGGLCALGCFEDLTSGELAGAIALSAGFGGLLGVLIDMAHVGRTTIFRAPPGAQLTPIVRAGTRGISVSVSF